MTYKPARTRPERFLGDSWEQIIQRYQGIDRQQAMALWQWGAIRFSSHGTDQARYFKRYGAAATFARINRVRAWLDLPAI